MSWGIQSSSLCTDSIQRYSTIFFLAGSVMTMGSAFLAGSHHRKIAVPEKVWKMPSLYVLAALVVRSGGLPMPDAIMRPIDTAERRYPRSRAPLRWMPLIAYLR